MTSKNSIIAFLLVLAIASLGSYYFAANPTKNKKSAVTTNTAPTAPPLPTKSPEEIKIIQNVKDTNVEIKNMAFTPQNITIKVNDQVFWTNNDTVIHKIKGEGWNSVKINPGEKFVQVFEKGGFFNYFCELHPEEKGTITVE